MGRREGIKDLETDDLVSASVKNAWIFYDAFHNWLAQHEIEDAKIHNISFNLAHA